MELSCCQCRYAEALQLGFAMSQGILQCLLRVVLTSQPLCTEKGSVLCSASARGRINIFLSPVPLCHSWMNRVEILLGKEGKKSG